LASFGDYTARIRTRFAFFLFLGVKGIKYIVPIELIKAEHRAESVQEDWAFDHPKRVAGDTLERLAVVRGPITGLKQKRKAQDRIVYEWKPAHTRAVYMVVVTRPYWLSFYARDPRHVAWVVAAAYESCGN
jgi:hypothetical protein